MTRMTKKVHEWCELEMRGVLYHGYNVNQAIDRCYGIVMFISNSVYGYDTPESKALADWWDDEMLPKFHKLEIERSK